MENKKRDSYQLGLLRGFLGIIIWIVFVFHDSSGFERIDIGGWLLFFSGGAIIFGVLFATTKKVDWLVSYFNSSSK